MSSQIFIKKSAIFIFKKNGTQTSSWFACLGLEYFRYSSPHYVKPSDIPSYGWCNMLAAARPLFLSKLKKNIGSDFDTRVWSNPWIPTVLVRPSKSKLASTDPNIFVNELIDHVSKAWKIDKLQDLISPEDMPHILGLYPSFSFSKNSFISSHTKSGNYIVRSEYLAAQTSRRRDCDLLFKDLMLQHFKHNHGNLTSRKN